MYLLNYISIFQGGDFIERKPNRELFALYYAQSGNVIQSALKAGYSKNYAEKRAHQELLDNVGVQQILKEIQTPMYTELILSALERQTILSEIAKSKIENTSDRIRAIDTLNKMTGEYIEKVNISGQIGTSEMFHNALAQLGGKCLDDE